MSHDVEAYCKTCGICATTKDANSKPAGLLHSLLIPDRPWQSIGMDFMGPFPKLNNFDYLWVVINQLTSQVHLVPTTMTVTTKGIVCLILKEVVRLHGIPESIVSDRDTKFCCDKVYVYLFSYQLQKRKELTKEEGICSSKVDECTAAHISYVGVRLRYLIYD